MGFGKQGLKSEPAIQLPPTETIKSTKKNRWQFSELGIRLTRVQCMLLFLMGLLGVQLANQTHTPEKGQTSLEARKFKNPEVQCRNREVQAYQMAKRIVSNRLKSPSTPWITSISSRYSGNCRYQVIAYVDAQNSFGATIRNYFSVKFKLDPNSKLWTPIDLNIE